MPERLDVPILDNLHNAGSRIGHERLARTGPDLLHGCEQPLGFCNRGEVKVDRDEVRVIHGLRDAVAKDTGSLAVSWIAVEHLLPAIEVRHGMLDAKGRHCDRSLLWL